MGSLEKFEDENSILKKLLMGDEIIALRLKFPTHGHNITSISICQQCKKNHKNPRLMDSIDEFKDEKLNFEEKF